jgi:hypothetical protein
MRTIPRVTFAATMLLLVAGAAACTAESPTFARSASAGPHFDVGPGFGSGNVASGNGGGNTGAVDSTSSTATRNGVGFGSGN